LICLFRCGSFLPFSCLIFFFLNFVECFYCIKTFAIWSVQSLFFLSVLAVTVGVKKLPITLVRTSREFRELFFDLSSIDDNVFGGSIGWIIGDEISCWDFAFASIGKRLSIMINQMKIRWRIRYQDTYCHMDQLVVNIISDWLLLKSTM